MIFKNLKIPVLVSGIGEEGTSSAVARSEREVKQQQARRQHITKTKIKQGMRKEIIHSFYAIAMGLLGSLSKDDVDHSENVI